MSRTLTFATFPLTLLLMVVLASCGEESTVEPDENTDTTRNDTSSTNTLPPGYEKFGSSVSVTLEGDEIVLRANGVPDHGSPYFGRGDSRYEAYNGPNPQFRQNPNLIQEQNLVLRIPRNPEVDPSHPATPMGPIGLALNGVPFYNQYAAMRAPLTQEINGFDQYNGHPQQQGGYHYHIEPLWLTAENGKDALLGFLLDGFPVYGPMEGGVLVTNADLDDYHGHVTPTAEYPEGIYHYHITAEDPYLNGTGFYGVPGTVSQ